MDGAAHPKGIHTPAPCTSFLHLNAPKCLCLGIALKKLREECLVKLLGRACGEHQAEEQEGNDPKKQSEGKKQAHSTSLHAKKDDEKSCMPLPNQHHVLAALHVHSFYFQAT